MRSLHKSLCLSTENKLQARIFEDTLGWAEIYGWQPSDGGCLGATRFDVAAVAEKSKCETDVRYLCVCVYIYFFRLFVR